MIENNIPKETRFADLINDRFDMDEKTDPIVDYVLRCIKGIFTGRFIHINLTDEGETFGCDPEADLTMYIENSGLSGKHAEIKYDNKKYYLRDLNSQTGTWILLREENPIPIYDNLEIKLGDEIYVFSFSEKNIEDQFEEWLKKLQLEKLKETLQKKGVSNLEQVKTLKAQPHDDLNSVLTPEEEKIFQQGLDDLEVDFNDEYETRKLLLTSCEENRNFEIGWSGAMLGNLENADIRMRNASHPTAPLELMIKYQYGHYWLITPYKSEENKVFVKLYKDEKYPLTPGDIINMGDLEFLVQRFNTGWFGEKGTRNMMEDMSLIRDDIGVSYKMNVSFYAVYDGHGGTDCVGFIHAHLLSTLRNIILKGQPFDEQSNFYRYIHEVCVKSVEDTDMQFLKEYNDYSLACGSAAIIVIIAGDRIICVNVGDSRAVLSRGGVAINLSKDHKPDSTEEIKRIQEAGGFVTFKRVCGKLGTSRAFGDFNFKRAGNSEYMKGFPKGNGGDFVSVMPEIRQIEIDYLQDEFIVLACDGLFDVFASQQTVDFVRGKLSESPMMEQDPHKVAKELVQEGIGRATSKQKHSDNISVIIICLTRGIPTVQKVSDQ